MVLTNERQVRSGLALAALAACLVGLLGFDGGIVWIVAGVWTIRVVAGSGPAGPSTIGLTWGLALLGAGMRWGTQSLRDVQIATDVIGPTVLSGSVAVRVGMGLAFAAALADEARLDGLRSGSVAEKAAAVVALIALIPAFVGLGAQDAMSLVGWAVAAAGITALIVLVSPYAGRLPAWLLPAVAAAAVALAVITA